MRLLKNIAFLIAMALSLFVLALLVFSEQEEC